MKVIVLLVTLVVVSEAHPMIGFFGDTIGLGAQAGVGLLEGIGSGLDGLIHSGIAMGLNGGRAMNAGLMAAQNGLGYASHGGVNGLLGGMELGGLGDGIGLGDMGYK